MSPSRYHHGNLPQALVDAAVHVIEHEGAHGLSLRKAARVAGVSHAAPAHHFGDLRGLLSAVAKRGYEGLLAAMKQDIEGKQALDRLRQVGQGYIRFSTQHAELFRAMYHPQLARDPNDADAHNEASHACFGYVVEVVTACQAEGTVRPGDAHQMAVFAWSTVHGAAALLVDRRLPPDDAVVEHLTRDLYLGLRTL